MHARLIPVRILAAVAFMVLAGFLTPIA
ncbi:MAG: hypothetical protein RLZZ461_2081, partial [Planctomycetota bacterium]